MLDSWVRYEGQVKARQQKELAENVISKIEKELEDPKVLKQLVLDLSTSGKLNDVNGSPNLLIYNNYTAAHLMMEEYASQLY